MEISVSYNVMQLSKRFAVVLLLCAGIADAQSDKVTVPLTDPARPAMVKADLLNGSITVTAYEGRDVVVEARTRNTEHPSRETGMKRVPMTATGLTAEEENNQVDIGANSMQRSIDLIIQVPRRTSLKLSTVNNGDITVTGVDGELDVNDVNGSVTLKNVSGNAVAHALNGRVQVNFERVNAQKPMAFSSLNGTIDVTFPPDLKATVSLASDRGDVFSDFDIQLDPRVISQTPVQGQREGGKFRVSVDKAIHGRINGGGQEIQFKNFNGSIYIRKAGTASSTPTAPAKQ